ncbi:MAG: 6-phosphogluconolactonase [Desulfovibrionales bacterium]
MAGYGTNAPQRAWRGFDDLDSMSQEAALLIAEELIRCTRRNGYASLALSGGGTPRRTYELLAQQKDIPWDRVHLFWGDERMVPLDHEMSNFRMAQDALLAKISIPEKNLHPMPVEPEHAGPEAAHLYQQELERFFEFSGPLPLFDLTLLGMGPDGHTASLFPNRESLSEPKKWVVWEPRPGRPPDVPRLSLTIPVFNRSKTVLFLVTASEKGEILDRIRHDPEAAARNYPAARINPAAGELVWMVASDEKN